MMVLTRPCGAAAVLVAMVVLGGCAASERQRRINTSPIPQSGNTLQAARKQLEGKWTLTSLEYGSPDGIYSYAPNVGDPERFERQREAIKSGTKVIPRVPKMDPSHRDGQLSSRRA